MGSFLDTLLVANTYRGELLGLMAIHLILLSTDRVHSNLSGSLEVISDCLGALKQVTDLPPYRISSRCKHSNILKNILVNCRDLSFTTYYSHVKAHQDDSVPFANLSQKAQLNSICDHTAKQQMLLMDWTALFRAVCFRWSRLVFFVNGEKNDIGHRGADKVLGTPPTCAVILQQLRNIIP